MTITCNGREYDVSNWNLSAVADAVWDNATRTDSFGGGDGCREDSV